MGDLIRAHNWAATSLGPVEDWPQSLKTAVRLMLNSRFAMFVWWGEELSYLYNDAYAPTLGVRHPQALGRSAAEVWSEIWSDIQPQVAAVLERGEATWNDELLLFLERSGFKEETYHTFSYSPIIDDQGAVGGLYCAVIEVTGQVISRRRMLTLRDLGGRTLREAQTGEQAVTAAALTLAANTQDLGFALIYLLDEGSTTARLAASCGLDPAAHSAAPASLELASAADCWGFAQVAESGRGLLVELGPAFGTLPAGAWTDDVARGAYVLPLARAGGHELPAGFLVVGLSPRLAFDDEYRGFLELVADSIATAVANARALEEERQRAAALAELDRAKTAFFSNVSHEFRTPLTLMLGPLASVLDRDEGSLPEPDRAELAVARRNGQRLLKLVNTLLDFARVEAGRTEAIFAPTDLAALTVELASMFRSAIERAGLTLALDCPPLPEAIYVDRGLWEQIVLNLLSNALKFTFAGTIAVELGWRGDGVVMVVRDSGIGIPAEALPRLFERFHRVEGARGRTHEGSGIGLALVQELVRLHGGSIAVESQLGVGTSFRVTLPRGTAHLPAERIGRPEAQPARPNTIAFVDEALSWLPAADSADMMPAASQRTPAPAAEAQAPPRIVLADDNADMRGYIARLLQPAYAVEAVPDGVAALAAIRASRPDLVISDVMMPHLDGFGLLEALRSDEELKAIPLVLLSARAGEEARVEGMAAGADDYLVKPFSARELLASVESRLELARLRRRAAEIERGLRIEAQAAHERLEQVLASITDAFVTLDRQWRFVYVNEAAVQMAPGKSSRDEFIGKRFAEVFPEALGTPFHEALERVMRERVPVRLEYHYPVWDRWLENRIYPNSEGLSFFTGDITERKQTEERLASSEARFRAVQQTTPDGFMIFESVREAGAIVDFTWVYVNPAAEAMVGRPAAALLGRRLLEVMPGNKEEGLFDAYVQVVATGELFQREFHYLHEGIDRWFRNTTARVGDGFAVTFSDISAQKRAERERATVAARDAFRAALAEALRPLTDIIAIKEVAARALGEHLGVSRAFFADADAETITIQRDYANGVPSAVGRYALDDFGQTVATAFRAGHTLVVHDIAEDPSLSEAERAAFAAIAVRSHVTVPFVKEGQLAGLLGVRQDSPRYWSGDDLALIVEAAEWTWASVERARAEAGLQALYVREQAARAAAEEASRLKDEFLATVSHELRTPLTSILGYGQMLQARERPMPYVMRTIDKIVRSARTQAQLIEDLLDVSRIITGKLRIEPEELDLVPVIHAAVDAVRPAVEARGQQLSLDLDDVSMVIGDPNRLQQVVWNLLSNAVKFTPSGGSIELTLRAEGQSLLLTVSDSGQGISADFMPYVFERFRQGDGTSTRANGGLGLGLAIVRHLVEMHGGTVHVQSDGENCGATFVVALPRSGKVEKGEGRGAEPGDVAGEQGCPPELQGLRVLVVDDQPDLVELIGELLGQCGAVVRTRTTAREALAELGAWRPDLLVSDIAMPGQDGYWLIEQVRALPPEAGGLTPAVALTAYVRVEDRTRVLAAGFQLYLPKPVEPAELLWTVARLVVKDEG